MAGKRKAQTSPSTTPGRNKNRKPNISYAEASSSETEGSDNVDQEWPVKCILAETQRRFLIEWEGDYPPNWVSSRCRSTRGPEDLLESELTRSLPGAEGERERGSRPSLESQEKR